MKKLFLALLILYTTVSFSQTYTFTGNGNWTIAANWNGSTIPPAVLPAADTIFINPPAGSSCILNMPQSI